MKPNNLTQQLHAAFTRYKENRLDQAEQLARAVLLSSPATHSANHLLALIERRRGRLELSLHYLADAIALAPDDPLYRNSRALCLLDLGRTLEAEQEFTTALTIRPDFAEARLNLALLMKADGRLSEAIDLLRSAASQLNRPEVYCRLGDTLAATSAYADAIASYRKALDLNPSYAIAHAHLGLLLQTTGQHILALSHLNTAVTLDPDNQSNQANLAAAKLNNGDHAGAMRCYDTAIALAPHDISLYWSRAMATLPQVADSSIELDTARNEFARQLKLLDDVTRQNLGGEAWRAVGTDQPFYLAYHTQNNRDLLAQYGALCTRLMAALPLPAPRLRTPRSDSLTRIAVVSAHVFSHSVWHALTKGIVSQLDRSRFDITLVSIGSQADHETDVAKTLTLRFFGGLNDVEAIANTLLETCPDVILYPEVGMDPVTVRLACLRLAPVQIAAWGHPQTTGLPNIDYFLSAEAFEPTEAQQHYSEQLITLPGLGSYLIAEDNPGLPEPVNGPLHQTMPDRYFLCPGTPYKYHPASDDVWVAIARANPDVTLIFFEHHKQLLSRQLRDRLHNAFDKERLEFAKHVRFLPWQSPRAFHALLRNALAMLDTIEFSGFNTALQAVACACPVIAYEGRFMRGRLASGLLHHINLSEMVADSPHSFVTLSHQVAQSPELRRSIGMKMNQATPLIYSNRDALNALEDFLCTVTAQNR